MIVFDIDGVLNTDDAPDELLDGFIVPDSTDEKLIEQEKSPLLIGSESNSEPDSALSEETAPNSSDNIIDAHFVSTPSADVDSLKALVGQPLEEVEKRFIDLTLKSVGGNREEAAKALNIGQRTLYRKIKDYGL